MGIFVFLLYFYFIEKKTVNIIILCIICNIILYFFDSKHKFSRCYICFTYILLSFSINCFRVKYFLPFFATIINEQPKQYLIFFNLLMFVNLNLFDLFFITVNLLVFFNKNIKKNGYYLLNFISLFVLLIEYINIKLIKISFYSFVSFLTIICLFYKRFDCFIFFLINILFKSFRSFYIDSLNYEFNEIGLQLTVLNYSILFSVKMIPYKKSKFQKF